MEFIGIDVHKRESQVCILAAEGEVIEKRIRTERERFAELLEGRSSARILIESSTDFASALLRVRMPPPPLFTASLRMVSGFLHPCCTYVARRNRGAVENPDRLSARVRAQVGVPLRHFDGDVSHQLLDHLERNTPHCKVAGVGA